MKRLLVLVEGQTEEVFVNRILQPHLASHSVLPIATIVETRHIPGRMKDKGGLTSWEKARKDITKRLRDTDAVTTTMFDFYGLPDDFPGNQLARTNQPLHDVAAVEAAMAEEFQTSRFIPFLAVHEFEAWVFAAPQATANHFGDDSLAQRLEAVVSTVVSVEHLNHGPLTHPSKRLAQMIPSYKKRSDGPTILEAIGVAGIRAACPHFAAWIARLEQLS